MKKILLNAAAVCTAVLAVISCNEGSLKTSHFEMSEAEALAEARTDAICFSVDIEYPVAGLKSRALEKINESLVKLCFGADSGTYEDAARHWADSCIAEYRKSGNELLKYMEGIGDDGPCAALSWEKSIKANLVGDYGDYVSFIVSAYDFAGGAHGSTTETAAVFNRKTGEVLGENDIFAHGSAEELGKLLSAHLREAMPDDDSYEALFTKNIEPNGNFYITPEGVTYIFGQYEIGPYYLGIIKPHLPWSEIDALLK